jgi:hypothetical protein
VSGLPKAVVGAAFFDLIGSSLIKRDDGFDDDVTGQPLGLHVADHGGDLAHWPSPVR